MFDGSVTLRGDRIWLSPMVEADRELLYKAASDPEIWAGHPARQRYLRDVFDPYFDGLLAAGGTLVARETSTERVIGCSRFYVPTEAPGALGIGFTFLVRDHWGGQSNRDMKTLMLDHAFAKVDTVWFHIDPSNQRSQRATAKLGAVYVETASLFLNGRAGTWQRWRLKRQDWTS